MARYIEAKVIEPPSIDEVQAGLSGMNEQTRAAYLAGLRIKMDRKQIGFSLLFPDENVSQEDGTIIYSRHLYPKQMEFFSAGALFRERALMAANRVGKTLSGAFETTSHLTGKYRNWWDGKRFNGPIRAWAVGKTNETTRDIVQTSLLGAVKKHPDGRKGVDGSGMIPPHCIDQTTIAWKQGVSDLIDTVRIKHEPTGEYSTLGFKSYQQGRGSFEGTAQHLVWLDEEAPRDIYDECLIRTTTTGGLVMLTFTPLEGLSETALAFLPKEQRPDGQG
jgi:phage terminase large subunit-like protein